MNISDIIKGSAKPAIYEKGSAFMWTDPHISKQLLQVHLNPELDLASRKKATILQTANWILKVQQSSSPLNILDLGCGPGLYAELFAQKGHRVTGLDISQISIEYAKEAAKKQDLDITYLNANYLELALEDNAFDLVVLIYTDLGVLPPQERDLLLGKIYRSLKKGGLFIFDVLQDKELETMVTPKSWEAVDTGFWKSTPYLALSESHLYEKEKVVLYQHHITDQNGAMSTYRFWTHFFSKKDVVEFLKAQGFTGVHFREDILPEGKWNADNVLFTVCNK
ncbi:class I SAM-dependent methyltransferase [Flammeovirgaceae bacterium SG7u.111]|nr:class I SAM-dependent methyltransferase [Flammeovirgaceae bacterium SG7u.132]WPO37134.1 class I SAM-dependent methyltransferase [Flammeovirgaceae bacterium SG7u.111]